MEKQARRKAAPYQIDDKLWWKHSKSATAKLSEFCGPREWVILNLAGPGRRSRPRHCQVCRLGRWANHGDRGLASHPSHQSHCSSRSGVSPHAFSLAHPALAKDYSLLNTHPLLKGEKEVISAPENATPVEALPYSTRDGAFAGEFSLFILRTRNVRCPQMAEKPRQPDTGGRLRGCSEISPRVLRLGRSLLDRVLVSCCTPSLCTSR